MGRGGEGRRKGREGWGKEEGEAKKRVRRFLH